MREIKFRGKDLNDQSWHFGDLEFNRAANVARIHIYDKDEFYAGQHTVDPDTIGQFTGLYDKNGREIYEGDLFRLGDHIIKVVYEIGHENGFALKIAKSQNLSKAYWRLPLDKSFCEEYEVIGNIYDNPELIIPDNE